MEPLEDYESEDCAPCLICSQPINDTSYTDLCDHCGYQLESFLKLALVLANVVSVEIKDECVKQCEKSGYCLGFEFVKFGGVT
jgi:hypothetical protein